MRTATRTTSARAFGDRGCVEGAGRDQIQFGAECGAWMLDPEVTARSVILEGRCSTHEECVEHLRLTEHGRRLFSRLPLPSHLDDVADAHIRYHPPVRLRLVHEPVGPRRHHPPRQPWAAHAGVAHLVGRVVLSLAVDVLGARRIVLQGGKRADRVGAGGEQVDPGRPPSPTRRARSWSQPPSAPRCATLALSVRRKCTPRRAMRSAIDGPPSEANAAGSSTP